jgi:hypothetical protein
LSHGAQSENGKVFSARKVVSPLTAQSADLVQDAPACTHDLVDGVYHVPPELAGARARASARGGHRRHEQETAVRSSTRDILKNIHGNSKGLMNYYNSSQIHFPRKLEPV